MTTELKTTTDTYYNMQRSSLASSGAQDKAMPLVVERLPSNEEAATITRHDLGLCRTRRKRAPNNTRSHPSFGFLNSSSLFSLILIGLLTILLQNPMVQAQESTTSSSSRQVVVYDLPTFSMLLHVLVETTGADDDDTTIIVDDPVYLDLEIFQETLERVTQFHLIDMFQQYEGFHQEQFIKVELATKVRQQDSLTDISSSSSNNGKEKHVPLQSAFSGVISYSFPTDSVPDRADVDQTIAGVLERALIGDNFLLLLQRYLSTGVLGAIQDIVEIQIGTKPILQLGFGGVEPAEESQQPQPPFTSSTDDDSILLNNNNQQGATSQNNNGNAIQSNNNNQQLNAITIVAIVTFLTLSCLLMLFGATVILVMKDRAKQEEALQGDTMTSLGMGSNGKGKDGEETDMDEEVGGRTKINRHGDSKDMPAWKRAVLPVLRRAILVRRYWKKQIRKQRRTRRNGATSPSSNGSPTEPAEDDSNNNEDDVYGDDGLNDEDIYYDDGLTDEEAANQWLDNWTQSLTSIPIRKVSRATTAASEAVASSPNKKRTKKKKKQPLAPHPAKRQSEQNFLGGIIEEEEDEEEESDDDDSEEKKEDDTAFVDDSVVFEDGLGDRHQELKSVIMDEDFSVGSPSLPTVSPSTKSYGSSARKKKQVEQDDLPAPLSLDLGDVDDLDHDDRIEDVDLS